MLDKGFGSIVQHFYRKNEEISSDLVVFFLFRRGDRSARRT